MSGPYIAVVGGGHVDEDLVAFARHVGRGIAEAGAVLVCGGLGEILSAAIDGATQAGGTTVALLPGLNRDGLAAEPTVAIPTGLGEGRNVLIARSCQAVIAIGGGSAPSPRSPSLHAPAPPSSGIAPGNSNPQAPKITKTPSSRPPPPTTQWQWQSRCHRPEDAGRVSAGPTS